MTTINGSAIKTLVVACDAGMGSSVMLAGQLRRQLKKNGVTVVHAPVAEIPAEADVIVTHEGLAERVRGIAPDTVIVAIQLFIGDPAVARLVSAIQTGSDVGE